MGITLHSQTEPAMPRGHIYIYFLLRPVYLEHYQPSTVLISYNRKEAVLSAASSPIISLDSPDLTHFSHTSHKMFLTST